MSLKFIARLEAAMGLITPEQLATPPFDEIIREGETVIGEVSESSIRLWYVLDNYAEKAGEITKKHDTAHEENGDHDCQEFYRQMKTLMEEGRLVKELFWREVREESGTTAETIAVRMSADGKPILVSTKESERGFGSIGMTIISMGGGPSLREILAGQL